MASRSRISAQRRLRVFLCHSSEDKPAVRKLYQQLQAEGIDPWLDEEKLLPGQNWEQEIRKAMRAMDVVIVCLSNGSVSKIGFLQKEIKFALDVADEQPEGTIFLIPVKLEECNGLDRLHHLHWVNLFQEKGYENLIRALQKRATELGLTLRKKKSARIKTLQSQQELNMLAQRFQLEIDQAKAQSADELGKLVTRFENESKTFMDVAYNLGAANDAYKIGDNQRAIIYYLRVVTSQEY